MMSEKKRIEVYMKLGAVGLSTNGAVVHVEDLKTVAGNVATRLTGGSVLELAVDSYYLYQFNIVGNGRFTLAVRQDGGSVDLESRDFESDDARRGAHGERSLAFKVTR